MLINLRNALMAGKRLPYDAEVEYLESTSTQYVDLGLNSTTDRFYNFEISFALTTATSAIPFGYAYGGTARYGLWNTGTNWLVGANNSNSIDLGAKDTDWHHVLTHFGTSVEVDGSTLAIGGGSVRANIGLNLFARVISASGATSRIVSLAKISFFRMWDTDGNLLRDIIPVRVGTVGYLYDRVSGQLFGNAGTGDFVLGPDVVPVEYIESHGTEWIDTGVPTYANARMEFGFMLNSSSTAAVFGNRIDAGRGVFFGTGTNSVIYCNNPNQPISPSATLSANTEYRVSQAGNNITINGIDYSASGAADNADSMYLFARRNGSQAERIINGRVPYFRIVLNDTPLRSFRSVRVGTEGAMMDVLTRRIYRNAGTGAFTYGNDLKYPIPAS